MLNLGKIQIGAPGALNQISYGTQPPDSDAVALSWNAGDFRYYIGTNTNVLGWRCTVGGTPGTWVQINIHGFDLYLSYGNQNGDGALPLVPEATPSFYLRPNTDKTVQQLFSGSPGAIWEYEVGQDVISNGIATLDSFIYSCALTPQPAQTATCTFKVSINGVVVATTANLDGLTNTRIGLSTPLLVALSPGDKVGVQCVTTNLSSGFLMATTHFSVR